MIMALSITTTNGEVEFKCSICRSVCICLRQSGAFYIPPQFKQEKNCNCIDRALDFSFNNHENFGHQMLSV